MNSHTYINDSRSQVILFLFGPHWIKVPPLSLVYLENYLTKNGFNAKVIDLNIEFYNMLGVNKKDWLSLNKELEDNLYSLLKQKFPDKINELIDQVVASPAKIVGFSLFARNRKATFEFVKDIKDKTNQKIFVFGGPEVLFEYHRKSFFEEVDSDNSYFVLGEGELALLEICKLVYDDKKMDFDLCKDKKLIKYLEINNIDALPTPNFDCLNIQNYNLSSLPLFSSRGCIKRCSFCSECMLYREFRQHSPEYMLETIKNLSEKYRINTFSFHDSLINADLKWLDRFCLLVIKENIKIKWEAQFMVREDLTDERLMKMKQSGCYNLFVGLESGSNRILKLMDKGYNQKIAKDCFTKLHNNGIQFEISLVLGFPSESEDDFKDTLQFLKENKTIIPKIAQLNPFVEYSPSKIHKKEYKHNKVITERINKLIKMFDQDRVKYTSSFINNLVANEDKSN